jgi:hypothetical protein
MKMCLVRPLSTHESPLHFIPVRRVILLLVVVVLAHTEFTSCSEPGVLFHAILPKVFTFSKVFPKNSNSSWLT